MRRNCSQCRGENEETQPTYDAGIEPQLCWWETIIILTAIYAIPAPTKTQTGNLNRSHFMLKCSYCRTILLWLSISCKDDLHFVLTIFITDK